uniref:Uncharacterized protein n=1 Tax=virus sp. ctqq75 TaxID=2827999 RepID=A0A8S5RE64_9VIRU|nr:MAG TPA: hypothetical protein [virus sp. ctqq75]
MRVAFCWPCVKTYVRYNNLMFVLKANKFQKKKENESWKSTTKSTPCTLKN